ncbi:DUF5615 family PIN-like protein [Rubrivirga sp. S365]|uniref:DUF5615 family PIN-like protein n=1 Tax=Rubrivirga sp. S365 TaxID=3076080 RepID=UPI0028C5E173|nr:DUF5615 family PIN-like protein [Rubrivirga sp. S365]MDT7855261.1 DUF5615 family PIN-like protein [Rubrivirga sp. S365]
MTLWIDAMLSPALARWITQAFDGVDAVSAQRLGLIEAKDPSIFDAARGAGAVVLTKDRDFADEVERRGSPSVVWLRVGNTTTANLKRVLAEQLPAALVALRGGEVLVELRDD